MAELRDRLGLKIGGLPRHTPSRRWHTATASSVWSNDPAYAAQLAVDDNPDSRWASQTPVCNITQTFASPTRIGRVVLWEYAERIKKFTLEAQVDGQWEADRAG